MKTFIKNEVTKQLNASAEAILEAGERHPWQLASELKVWTPPGVYTHEVEVEIARTWFGEEAVLGRLNLPNPWCTAVAHAVVQAVFDSSKKKYNAAQQKRDVFKRDATAVWNGKRTEFRRITINLFAS